MQINNNIQVSELNIGAHTALSARKKDFPVFDHYPDLVYLDSAATAHKPRCVIDSLTFYYETANANAHRGVYKLAEQSSLLYEDARKKVASHLSVKDSEIVFTKGTTESINMVAQSYLKPQLQKGDLIVIGGAEHHANVVPWQEVAKEKGASIEYINILEDGSLDLLHYERLLSLKPKMVSVAHVSNVLGTINPIEQMVSLAHQHDIPILIDAAQSIGHLLLDLSTIQCDFLAFSGHKAYGPMGIGCLFIDSSHHDEMVPYQTGGGMIEEVGLSASTFQEVPQLLEAGTQNVADAHALSVGLEYMRSIGLDVISAYESDISMYAYYSLSQVSGVRILGPSHNRAPVLSFAIEGIHPHDIATVLGEKNIAVRAGHHCSQHAMNRFKMHASVRASFALYNVREDVDAFIEALLYAKKVFKVA